MGWLCVLFDYATFTNLLIFCLVLGKICASVSEELHPPHA